MTEIVGIALGFVLGFVGSMPLTGPVGLLVFTKGVRGRYRDAVAAGVGGSLAESGYCAAAVAGVGALITGNEAVESVVRLVAVPLLLAFGAFLLVGQRLRLPTAAEKVLRPMGLGKAFAQGFSVSFLNPVLVLNWSAFITGVHSVTGTPLEGLENVAFVVAAFAGVASWFTVLTFLLRKFEGRLPIAKLALVVKGAGAFLVASGLVVGADALFRIF